MSQPNPDDEPVTAAELAAAVDDKAALALMLTLMQRSRQEADHITNGLMAGYQRDYYRTAATLEVARLQVEELFTRGYMPTPDAVLSALYPDPAAVAERAATFETRGYA